MNRSNFFLFIFYHIREDDLITVLKATFPDKHDVYIGTLLNSKYFEAVYTVRLSSEQTK